MVVFLPNFKLKMKITKMRIIKSVFLLATLSIMSCKKDSRVQEQPADEIQVSGAVRPKPMKVYSKDGINVDAYDFEGLEHFLKKDNDTTYVVNFWATWCVPCVEELPHFERLNKERANDKVKVLLVSLDMHKMIESKLIPFIKDKQLQSDVVLLRDPNADAWIPKVSPEWSGAIPATVIYKGAKRNFYEKSFTYEELQKEVDNFK